MSYPATLEELEALARTATPQTRGALLERAAVVRYLLEEATDLNEADLAHAVLRGEHVTKRDK